MYMIIIIVKVAILKGIHKMVEFLHYLPAWLRVFLLNYLQPTEVLCFYYLFICTVFKMRYDAPQTALWWVSLPWSQGLDSNPVWR